jgi:hypothetical protein
MLCNMLKFTFHIDFLHGLFFDLEVGGDILLQNVSWLLKDYKTVYLRK